MTTRVEASAPCRVDLAGGTLDIWPLGLLHRGARTLNVAIDVEVRAVVEPRQRSWVVVQEGTRIEAAARGDLLASSETALIGWVAEHFDLPPVAITVASASPRGAGLGASSALAVALILATERFVGIGPSSVSDTVHLARDLEARLMGLPTGIQDHYPALLGGAIEILHRPGGEEVRRIALDLEHLGRSLLLAYSGGSHLSAANNFEVVSRRLRREGDATARFDEIAAVAVEMSAALAAGDLARVGRLMRDEWRARRELAPVVGTEAIERILDAGAAAGAWGGKVCGAGGGGCVVLLAPAGALRAVAERVSSLGHPILRCRPTLEAARIR